ncbi:hypothetical protein PybrP1_003793 [[Pythium] brassicae (nom. inval.)]|nr:hypothetical protein PybrP1_003793 [[Pythium] brassicae (nom. inval.)]
MASKLAPRPPPVSPSPALLQSPAVASVRRSSAPHHHRHHDRDHPRHRHKRNENNDLDPAGARGKAKISPVNTSSSSSSEQPSEFPATEFLLQTVEEAVYDGAFHGERAAAQGLLALVGAARLELKAKRRHIVQLDAQNSELEGECLRYKSSVWKIQTQSEHLRRSSRGKDALCDTQLQKLVVLLREVQGYEEEPELSEDEQQQQQLAPLKASSSGDGGDGGSSDSDDAAFCDSNQIEEDQAGGDREAHDDDGASDLVQRNALPPRGSASAAATGGSASRSSEARGSRLKFQFPDVEVNEGDFEDDGSAAQLQSRGGAPLSCVQRRRFSSSAAISTAVPLRRKSFTMKRSPGKRIAVSTVDDEHKPAAGSPEASAAPSRWATRRKSTSACFPPPRSSSSVGSRSSSRSPAKWAREQCLGSPAELAARRDSAAAASPRSSQMVVRVRERKADGVPELVICKKPSRFVVWQWNERQVRIPFVIQLGPQQHGVMLRQLRFVKSVMHDLPWAKAHLKDLLSAYTKKHMSKEQLYPQLNHLSHHVQAELGGKAKKQLLLAAKKQHLTLQLTLAAGAVNELHMIKFGRRGKPHETRLCYDPSDPTRLHWLRKNGDRSDEFLPVDEIDVRGADAHLDSSVLKRAARKYPLDPDACVSLVSPARSLDLQLKSSLQRDWLVNALRDVISFAKQYKAAGALGRRAQSQKNLLAKR